MKNYLVIGGSSGIGQAITTQLSEEGHHVYASYFKHPQSPNNSRIHEFHLDATKDSVDQQILPEHLDGFVYCPGSINLKPFVRITPEDFLADYNLQVTGAIRILQSVLHLLKKSEQASIVFFSTVAVQMGYNFHSQVSASKGAIEGLTRALSAEFTPKIRVNCVAPSLTQTPLASHLLANEDKIKANADRHPLKRIGEATDIAEMACFLLTNKSSWMTGQVIHVDGGMSSIKG